MRTLQEWMGHSDIQTTMIYADYAPNAHELDFVNAAFSHPDVDPAAGYQIGYQTESNTDQPSPTRTTKPLQIG
jgi:hypothetical protein